MIRKNLILVIVKNDSDEDEIYLSNYIPGCLDWDEYIDEIKFFSQLGQRINPCQNLTNLKQNSKIVFSKVNGFSFNPSKNDDEKLDVVDNFYIINTTEEYKDINCLSRYMDEYYRKNDFISCPESISCFSLATTEKKNVRYEVKSIN